MHNLDNECAQSERIVHRVVDCFYPGKSFPALSVTGQACMLNCKHCARNYLKGMTPATSPAMLLEIADGLVRRGAKGFLLSGGSDPSGKVGLSQFISAIEMIKLTTDLKINAHIGLSPREELDRLVSSGIDSFSIDVFGDDDTIQEVLGLKARASDYFSVLKNLKELGAKRIAPHLCIGINQGKIKGEFDAISKLESMRPDALILLSLIPTKGTPYGSVRPPSLEVVKQVVERARVALPHARLILGCMRSRSDRASECDLVRAGLDGIVLPAAGTLERLQSEGFVIRKRAECCSLT